jgi:hypothetical protein
MNLPFFDTFIVVFPIIAGTITALFSFSDRMYESWVKNLSEKTANRNRVLFRYGGLLMVLLGVTLYFVD